MTTATATATDNHSEQQAKVQLESIREMIAALNRGGAADLYASELSRERCIELLTSVDIATDDDETTEELREAVARNIEDETIEPDDFEFDADEARQTVEEDPLSVEIRSDWYTPGTTPEPAEFCILLCTGVPAVRIVGELDEHRQPSSARLQHQDWSTPWTEYIESGASDVLLEYSQVFYYGE